MLKCKAKYGKYAKVETKGTVGEVAVELMAVIKTAYLEIHSKNPLAADEFKRTLMAGMIDPKSPVFKTGPLSDITK